MYHFLKYLLLVLFILIIFLFFYSNHTVTVSLVMDLPFVDDLASRPIPVIFLIMGSFVVGILFAAFIGAFRMALVKEEKRRLVELRNPVVPTYTPPADPNTPSLPPLA
ncbi:hypothetical protein K1X76_10155 [bacterium]|nr:hypothetical protein [bacterium]